MLTIFCSLQFDPCPRAGEPMVSRRKQIPPDPLSGSLSALLCYAVPDCAAPRLRKLMTSTLILLNRHARLLPLSFRADLDAVPREKHEFKVWRSRGVTFEPTRDRHTILPMPKVRRRSRKRRGVRGHSGSKQTHTCTTIEAVCQSAPLLELSDKAVFPLGRSRCRCRCKW